MRDGRVGNRENAGNVRETGIMMQNTPHNQNGEIPGSQASRGQTRFPAFDGSRNRYGGAKGDIANIDRCGRLAETIGQMSIFDMSPFRGSLGLLLRCVCRHGTIR